MGCLPGPEEGPPEGLPELLGQLSPLERQVLVLRSVHELSYQEIALITGKAEGTLRNLMSKTLARLRKEGKTNEAGM